MSLIDAISDALTPSPQGTTGDGDDATGSYWCDDCTVRVLDVEVDAEGLDRDPDGVPLCPDCDEPMRFERTGGPGCAC
ncbi:hypothetical protein [Halorubrum luteum]